MKKRVLSFILTLAMCFGLCACGDKEPTAEEQIEQTKEAIEALSDNAEDKDAKRQKLINKNNVELKEAIEFTGAEVGIKVSAYSIINWEEWGDKKDQIYFAFEHTNNGTNDEYFSSQAKFDVYQDGIALAKSGFLDENWSTQIRPGATIERMEAFNLRNKESDVVLKITEYKGNQSSEYTIKIK